MMLAGIRVVEMGQNVAGPHASQILADLGAEVVKVERPGGEEGRKLGPPFAGSDPAWFHQLNRNKKSIIVDLKDAAGRDRLLDLLGTADVFLHNLRPGVLVDHGLGAQVLRQRFPRLIHADIGAFGHLGPHAARPGYELLMQAYGGLMSITGGADAPPTRLGPSVVDLGTGMWTAIGILAALYGRQHSGVGVDVQTSLFETAVSFSGVHIVNYLASGEMPARSAAGFAGLAPYGSFPTADGDIIIGAGNDRLFGKLAELLGHGEWQVDTRFSTNVARVANRAELETQIKNIMVTQSSALWLGRLEQAGVPCAPVRTIPQLVDDEQTRALGLIDQLEAPSRPHIVRLPISFDGERPRPSLPTPRAGEHDGQFSGTLLKDPT